MWFNSFAAYAYRCRLSKVGFKRQIIDLFEEDSDRRVVTFWNILEVVIDLPVDIMTKSQDVMTFIRRKILSVGKFFDSGMCESASLVDFWMLGLFTSSLFCG